ncbi:MAG: putative bifunctional diguanylate cyclase/phosphodiesterase [Ignavibacteria bacterium]
MRLGLQRSYFSSATPIVLSYCVVAGLWILLSDRITTLLVADVGTLALVESLKGVLFVAVTGTLLYLLLRAYAKTVRKESLSRERAIKMSHRRLLAFVEEAPVPLAMLDRDMRYLAASRRWKQDLGLGERNVLGRCHYDLFPDIPPRWKEVHRKALAGDVLRKDEDLFVRSNGEEWWLRWEVQPWHTEDGSIGGIMMFSEDISARKLAESELRIAATAFESQQGVFVTDAKARILRVNRMFEKLTGYSADEVVGKTPALLDSGRHGKEFYDELRATLNARHTWRGEIWSRRKDGDIYPQDLSIAAVMDDRRGIASHYVGIFTDLSGSKRAEQAIHHLSFYDELTGLPNRRLLLERLAQDLRTDRRQRTWGAILKIDLDRFSLINDTNSRWAGDIALVEIGRRLTAQAPEGAMVVRLGNDEFAVFLDDLGHDEERAALAARERSRRLMAAIKAPLRIEGATYVCTASVGVRLFIGGDTTADNLLRQAHSALRHARQLGHDSFHFYSQVLQESLEKRVLLESRLSASQAGDFVLHYQPQVGSAGRVTGAEALLRWRRSGGDLIPPGEFIHLAEETGFILQLGRWVLESACRQLRDWTDSPRAGHLTIAVNVSAKQLAQPGFVDEVSDIVRSSGIDPSRLELELTESMLIGDAAEATGKMRALRATGIRFSLDDFGTGFSSLAYLRRMPLDKLKIDQSFVADVHRNAGDAAIVRTIIALGRSLELAVVAEGVEEEAQLSFLAGQGCNSYQGYLFGRPAAPDQFFQALPASGRTLH